MKAALLFDKMPRCCSKCRLFITLKINRLEEGYCLIGDDDYSCGDFPTHIPELEHINKKRPHWCPLVEINIEVISYSSKYNTEGKK